MLSHHSIDNRQNNLKMIDFIKHLYKQYKILNKLSEKQSNDFQKEVVTKFVDSQQNVNAEIYQSILEQIGLQRYILDTLSLIINRNPFKNQFQLNRNLTTITENIKKEQEQIIKKTQQNNKKQEQLNKRQKNLIYKQQKFKNLQQSMLNIIKNKMNELQNDVSQRLLKKQGQIKKTINALTKQLKNKEKIVIDRYQLVKNSGRILNEIEEKQRNANEKLKMLQKRQKQNKSKQIQILLQKKSSQLQEMKGKLDKSIDQNKDLSRRYKNLQLSYKKLKNQNEQLKRKKQENAQIYNKNTKIPLQDLCISNIQHEDPCENILQHLDYQQMTHKIQSIQMILSSKQHQQAQKQIIKIKKILHLQLSLENNKKKLKQSSSSQNQSDEDAEIYKINLNSCQQKQEGYLLDNLESQEQIQSEEDIIVLIQKLKSICENDILNIINGNILEKLINKCHFYNLKMKLCESILQLMIELMEQKQHYDNIINMYSHSSIIMFLQKIYLAHETDSQIIETSTLLLSRIKIKGYAVQLLLEFRRALQMRRKVQSRSSFLYGNIKYILQ